MACFIFLPVVLELLSGNRWNVDRTIDIAYSLKYYGQSITGFISPFSSGFWSYKGYCAIALIAVLCLFSIRNQYKELKIGFLILTAILFIPAGGYILNGFSYVSNRWIWGYSFLVAFILTSMIPELLRLSKKRLYYIALMSIVYIVFYCISSLKNEKLGFGPGIVFIAFLVLLVVSYQFRIHGKYGINGTAGIRIILLGLISINIFINAQSFYSPTKGNYIEEFHESGTALKKMEKNSAKAVQEIDDSGFYRYEENTYKNEINYNTALQTKLNSINYYFSLSNGNISKYLIDLNMNIKNSYKYSNLDGRAILGALANVKYFICREGDESYLPYGYTELINSYTNKKGETYHAYENKYVLPLGFTYSNTISENEYRKLSAIEKQQALMQAIVLEKAEDRGSSQILRFIDKNIDYKMELEKGVKLDGNAFHVTSEDAQVMLSFSGQKECENYLSIKNLNFKNKKGKGRKEREKRKMKPI